jgi:antitoxin ParD1/3/4
MNISLTQELEDFVARKVESGLYQTASEVIREGLRLLRERDELHQHKLEELRREIALGLEEAEQGKGRPLQARQTLDRVRKQRAAHSEKNR